jgi:hypothetical protein
MLEIKLSIPRPHVNQQHVIATSRRFNVVDCGRRWGKTVLGMDRAIDTAIHGRRVGWFAPSYKQLSEVWRELKDRLTPVVAAQSEQEKRIGVLGGGSVEMWSLDSPDSGRGRAYARVIIDEAALIPNLKDTWEKSIRAMLTDYQGDAWFLSTPKGLASDFYTLWNYSESRSDWAAWTMPTSSNPFIVPAEIESARQDLTDLAFAQEYLAQFVSWEGTVFRRIREAVYPVPVNPTSAVLIGVDWGRTQDYTVFVAIDPRGYVVAIERFRGVEYSLQRARLHGFWGRTTAGRGIILAEVNSMGGPVVEQLQRDGLPVMAFLTNNASKEAAIDKLALSFERGEIRIPDDPVLIGELQAFAGKTLPSGRMRYGAPEGQHDDTVMALAIGWSGFATNPRPVVYLDVNTGRLTDHQPRGYEISPY